MKKIFIQIKTVLLVLKAKEQPLLAAAKRFGYAAAGTALVALLLVEQVSLDLPPILSQILKYTVVFGGAVAGTAKLSTDKSEES